MIKVVLISGKQGSGKSTLAARLVNRYNQKPEWLAQELKFAAPLYVLHDAILEQMQHWGIVTPKIDGRLLQLLGTDWGRNCYGEDLWVKVAQTEVARIEDSTKTGGGPPNNLIVFSDCRFPNELEAFTSITALRVRLSAPESVRKERAEKWREDVKHPSEVALDEAAMNGGFDLYLPTDTMSIDECVELIARKVGE